MLKRNFTKQSKGTFKPFVHKFAVTVPVPELTAKGYHVQTLSHLQWGDEDKMGHLNHAKFLTLFETARVLLMEHLEMTTSSSVQIAPILASLDNVKYRAPLHYPDDLVLCAKIASMQEKKFVVNHCVWSANLKTIACIGDCTIVSYNYVEKKSVPLPKNWVDNIKNFEGIHVTK